MATRISDSLPLSCLDDQYFNELTFICHFCNAAVNTSTFLSCLHSFCKNCIQANLRANSCYMECPVCPGFKNTSVKLGYNPLPELINKVKRLKSAVESAEGVPMCKDCVSGEEGQPAVAYCVECDATICQFDLNSHKKYMVGHSILYLDSIQGYTVQGIMSMLLTSTTQEMGKQTDTADSIVRMGDECILEATSHIARLEKRKEELDNKCKLQTVEVIDVFQDLHDKLNTRQAAVLNELSRMYQTLMQPLEETITRLEEVIKYTQFVGTLSKYSLVAGISQMPADRIRNLTASVFNFNIPYDNYSVSLEIQTEDTIIKTFEECLVLDKKELVPPKKFLKPISDKNRSCMHALTEIKLCDKPLDIAYDCTAQVVYVVFNSFWRAYNILHFNSLIEIMSAKLLGMGHTHTASISKLGHNIFVLLNFNFLYVYSDGGELKNSIVIKNVNVKNELISKMYAFPSINSLFLASLHSSCVDKLDHNGENRNSINLINLVSKFSNPQSLYFIDMSPSPRENNQIFILLQLPNNRIQYLILVLSCIRERPEKIAEYILTNTNPPFCSLGNYDSKSVYLLDVSTGTFLIFDCDKAEPIPIPVNQYYGSPFGRRPQSTSPIDKTPSKLQSEYAIENTIPLTTSIKEYDSKQYAIRSFIDTKESVFILLSGEQICILPFS